MNAHRLRQLCTSVKVFLRLAVATLLLASCSEESTPEIPPSDNNTVDITYNFSSDAEGWLTDFADYPVGEEDFYELASGHAMLPPPLDETDGALRLSGSNRSDDLFMFAKKKLDGLSPNTTYKITFDMDIASDAASGSVGIGGGPGEAVNIKIGASSVEPVKVIATEDFGYDAYYVMNIDKGNQFESGEDMIRIGDFENGIDEFVYALINRNNTQTPFEAQTNDAGELWLVVGTDSGFEGITTIYYTKIAVSLEPQ
ncbi:MAG: hypothetical protein AAF267_04720 [Deinococcota bacterium]